MIECEIKYRVLNEPLVSSGLSAVSTPDEVVYRDTYFCRDGGASRRDAEEFRIRRVERRDELVSSILTWKSEVVDLETDSKTEVESEISDPDALHRILLALGLRVDIDFSKHCVNWRIDLGDGLSALATLAYIPEIEDRFLEIEVLVEEGTSVPPVLAAIRDFAETVGLGRTDETRETYTESVREFRSATIKGSITATDWGGVRHVSVPDGSSRAFSGILFDVYQWRERLFDGSSAIHEMARRPDCVVVLLGSGERLLLTEQEQPGIENPFYDFPGGRVDPGESPVDAARRELVEETGIETASMRLAFVFQASDRVDYRTFVYVASGTRTQRESQPDAGEIVRSVWLTLDEVKKWSLVNHRLAIPPVLLADTVAHLLSAEWAPQD